MAKYIIQGGSKINGQISIGGNKNAVLPCLATALLTDQAVTLYNVPEISDVDVMLQILEYLGSQVRRQGEMVTLFTPKIVNTELPLELVSKLRASVLLAGPLLARAGKVKFHHPGGDVIGKRSIQTHLDGFERLGFNVTSLEKEKKYEIKLSHHLKDDVEFFLDEASVTATENLLMAAATSDVKITFKNCAREPHIVDLCNLLEKMGVKIDGIGQSTITVQGTDKFNPAEYTIGADPIEMGTYAVAAAMTGGKVSMTNCTLKDMEPVTLYLEKMGIEFQEKDGVVTASSKKLLSIPKLHTNIWPGFPPDLMSPVITLATQASGISLFHDWMYESRMFFVDKLILMGANITIADPHRVVVYGPTKLYGRNLETPDIRAGMALVIAALVADGQSVINRAELIERGYPNVLEKLQTLGVNIQRVD